MAQSKRIQTLAVTAGIWGAIQPALANCAADMQKLTQDRNVQLQIVNDFAKAAHGKPMDPTAFCVKSAGLIRAESALIAYMEKNKDWCSFPDEAINQLKEHHARNADFNAKACSVALTLKKIREPAGQDSGDWPRTVVPLVPDGGSFTVPVTINGRLTLNFVVDSGASDVSVPADVVMTLVRTGTITDSDFLGETDLPNGRRLHRALAAVQHSLAHGRRQDARKRSRQHCASCRQSASRAEFLEPFQVSFNGLRTSRAHPQII